MKLNKKIYGFALVGIAGLGLASCSNDLNEPSYNNPSGGDKAAMVHLPDVYAWSGDEILGVDKYSTRSFDTAPSGERDFERWQSDRSWSRPENIIEAERDYVLAYLQANPNGGYKTLDIYNYVIQVVGGGHHSYTGDTADHNGTWHTIDDATNQMNQAWIDGFFTQYNNGHEMNSEDPILIKNVQATDATYHDSYANLTQSNLYAFYFITFPNEDKYGYIAGKTGLYLCYDYATYKDSEKWGVTADGIYDDWVIKLTPADGSDVVNPDNSQGNPGDNNGDDNPGNGNVGDDNNNGDDSGNDTNTPGDNQYYVKATDEVEVNLSINDVHTDANGQKYDNADLWTKLSIHVRKATDVKITMPIPAKYLCESDDFAIFEDHISGGVNVDFKEGNVHTTDYTITDSATGRSWTVSLTVTIGANDITVETSGINGNTALIEYLYAKNGDGINFEVWNYYQTETVDWVDGVKDGIVSGTLEDEDYVEFRNLLNGSTIEFKYNEPAYYINAFNELDKNAESGFGTKNANDCTVDIVGSQKNDYENAFEGTHLNGSRFNKIYKSKGYDKEHPAVQD